MVNNRVELLGHLGDDPKKIEKALLRFPLLVAKKYFIKRYPLLPFNGQNIYKNDFGAAKEDIIVV